MRNLSGQATMPATFSSLLKSYRLRAGYGLRQFAELIGESSANYANRESGNRGAWVNREKLRSVAEVLGLREGSRDWYAFFLAALGPGRLPPDTEHLLENPMIPVLMRTVDEARLTDDELQSLIDYIRSGKHK
jgi:transcriptional regulator with XRE-family HTH domain